MADTYNALYGPELGYPGDAGYFRTPMRQPNALIGPVWENSHAAPQQAPQRPADWAVTSGVAEAISPTMGAYGMGAGIGQTYNALSRGDYAGAAEAGLPLAAMAMMPGPKGMGKLPAAAEQPKGIRAYHGSPHDFDRFDISKIGTGEGAQAYGHGLYFAENEGVAKNYREQLANDHKIDGKPLNNADPAHQAAVVMNEAKGNRADAISILEDSASWPPDPAIDAAVAKAREMLSKGFEPPKIDFGGRMYEVNIKADPEHFLDWDKPLSQQSEKAKAAWESFKRTREFEAANKSFRGDLTDPKQATWADPTGKDVRGAMYESQGMAPPMKADAYVTQRLKEAGIPGIRYLDQGSRGVGEGSRNYVVFDPATIEILRKYGLLGPMAGGVGVNALYGSENQ